MHSTGMARGFKDQYFFIELTSSLPWQLESELWDVRVGQKKKQDDDKKKL